MAPPLIRLIVVDDDAIVRSALAAYAEVAPDVRVVGVYENGADAVAAVAAGGVDVVLMDVRMPVMDGITATARIHRDSPRTKILLLTSFDEDDYMISALRVGASGFLLKDASPKTVVDAVHAVAGGATVLSPEPLGRLVRTRDAALPAKRSAPPHVELSPRELDILRLLCQALTNAEIADRLFLAESTVKTHVSAIMAKLLVTTRLKAVVRAYEWGLVQRDD